MDVPFSDRHFYPKTEIFHSDFGRCPNTKLSGTKLKVERPRTKRVQISDVDCTVKQDVKMMAQVSIKQIMIAYMSCFDGWAD